MESLFHTLTYLVIGLATLLIGAVLFSITTKMSERKQILEEANTAAAIKLGGKMLGLAIVIWAAAQYSLNVVDYSLWSVFGLAAQILSYWIVEHLLFPKISLAKKVEEGNKAVAILLFMISVSVGLIIAGSLSYDAVYEMLKNQ
ncbi:DUF350 domain-containing protein [Metabacillus sp. KIGAM252]|uniref:DUF350 domain-containing protein n=1 Tax=Metabacillus flavus TaxID=2823519 RepID=A0ABS5LJ59_9BACI|nr:DUF350 domain-containing protein [Metabacillus flavus]MBS2970781.1 DUF350 domain-containing protein [Metabacillus flavus]